MACWMRRAAVLPRTIDDARVDAVIARTLESVPRGATHCSTCTMASTAGLPQTAVSRIWRAFGLPPHDEFLSDHEHRSSTAFSCNFPYLKAI